MKTVTSCKNSVNTQLALLLNSDIKKFGISVKPDSKFGVETFSKDATFNNKARKYVSGAVKNLLNLLKNVLIFIFKVFYYILLFSFKVVFYTFKLMFLLLKILVFPILLFFMLFIPTKRSADNVKDCANGKPHYGYRYGRWYYGHNHVEGCEYGDSTCSGGRD